MNCRELAYLLEDYLSGAMPKHLVEDLDCHIANCAPCLAFLKTYKATVQAVASVRHEFVANVPPEMENRLAEFMTRLKNEAPTMAADYHRRALEEVGKTVEGLVGAYRCGSLSEAALTTIDRHLPECDDCRAYFGSLPPGDEPLGPASAAGGRTPGSAPTSAVPPTVLCHLSCLMETLPPGDDFFLP